MAPAEPDGPVISYSIKDILERLEHKLDSKFDQLAVAISDKANATDMAQVMASQINLTERIAGMERWRDAQKERTGWRSQWRRWLTEVLLAAALVAVSVFQVIHG